MTDTVAVAVDDYYHLARRCLAATASAIAGSAAYIAEHLPRRTAAREVSGSRLHVGWSWLTFVRLDGGYIRHIFNPGAPFSRCGMRRRNIARAAIDGAPVPACGHCAIAARHLEVTP